MKNLIFSLLMLLVSQVMLQSQDFSRPECIRWDPVNETYLVSNVAGYILAVDPLSLERTEWANEGLSAPKGMVVSEGIVYVTDLTEVEGFSLADASHVFHLAVPGAVFLNGITADSEGFLYAADTQGGKLFKINPQTSEASELAASGLNGINGVILDEEQNRVIAVFWRANAPIAAIDLDTGEVSELLSTNLSNLDGITRDNCGNYYFSSWGTHTVYKTSPDFAEEPAVFYTNLSGPADIFFDQQTQKLWVPKFNANEIASKPVFLTCMAPALLSPENGATDQPTKHLDFEWEPVLYSKAYKLELSLSPVFDHILMELISGDPSVSVEQLDLNTEYFWRVWATDGESLTDPSAEYSFTTEKTSGVDAPFTDRLVSVFPNPASGRVMVRAEHAGQVFKWTITNLTGQVLWREASYHSSTLDVSVTEWPEGLYFVIWHGSKGTTGSTRLIVQ